MGQARDDSKRSVAIAGAGLVGLAVARALQKAGYAVTLFDPEEPSSGASAGNAGIIAGSAVVPEANGRLLMELPRLLLDPKGPLTVRPFYLPRLAPFLWHFAKASRRREHDRLSRAMAALSLSGFDNWMTLLDDLPDARALFRRDGCLYVYLSERERQRAVPDNDLRRARGMRLAELSPEALHQRVPDLEGETAGAILAEDAGQVLSPQALGRFLFERIVADGGEFHPQPVTRLLGDGDRIDAVATPADEAVPVTELVLAAGAHSGPLARELGLTLPLDTQRGYHLMLRDPGVETALPMLVPSAGIAITPMQDGLRIAGLVEFAGLQAPPNPKLFDLLAERAAALFPRLRRDRADRWMGCRPSLPDGLPVIDRAPRFANAYLAFGHGQVGLTQAAITGHIIRGLVEGSAPPVELAPYRASRFRAA